MISGSTPPSDLPGWWLGALRHKAREYFFGTTGRNAILMGSTAHEHDRDKWASYAWLLRDALIAYGVHRAECAVFFLGACSCGLEDVRRAVDADDKQVWAVYGQSCSLFPRTWLGVTCNGRIHTIARSGLYEGPCPRLVRRLVHGDLIACHVQVGAQGAALAGVRT